jgi:hypothetical protein
VDNLANIVGYSMKESDEEISKGFSLKKEKGLIRISDWKI